MHFDRLQNGSGLLSGGAVAEEALTEVAMHFDDRSVISVIRACPNNVSVIRENAAYY